jgi:hypothetical protein
MIKRTDMAHIIMRTKVKLTKAILKMESNKVLVAIATLMEMFFKVIFQKVRKLIKELLIIEIILFYKEIGKMDN